MVNANKICIFGFQNFANFFGMEAVGFDFDYEWHGLVGPGQKKSGQSVPAPVMRGESNILIIKKSHAMVRP